MLPASPLLLAFIGASLDDHDRDVVRDSVMQLARDPRPLFQHRLAGGYSSSPIFADGRIYFLNEDAVTTVIAPGKEFRVLATNQLEGTTLASMAVAIFVIADSAADGSSGISPPRKYAGSSMPSSRSASVTVGCVPPRP